MKVIDYFGFNLPIVQINVSNWKTKKKQLLELYNEDTLITDDGYPGLYIKHNYELYKDEEESSKILTGKYYNILQDELDLIFKCLKFKETVINYAWFECAKKDMYHGIHNHGALGFSSCLYLEYDESIHQPVILIAPYNDSIGGDMVEYHPEGITEGTLLFFPAQCPHFTQPNISDKTRLVMSANYGVSV
tara:strand:+ start:120 stop:689 length:570 start_codon:yes stop_codon:yes gene_type:complete